MIKVESREIEGVFSPLQISNTKFGNHFDGVFFYFFESDTERIEFYLTLEHD